MNVSYSSCRGVHATPQEALWLARKGRQGVRADPATILTPCPWKGLNALPARALVLIHLSRYSIALEQIE